MYNWTANKTVAIIKCFSACLCARLLQVPDAVIAYCVQFIIHRAATHNALAAFIKTNNNARNPCDLKVVRRTVNNKLLSGVVLSQFGLMRIDPTQNDQNMFTAVPRMQDLRAYFHPTQFNLKLRPQRFFFGKLYFPYFRRKK